MLCNNSGDCRAKRKKSDMPNLESHTEVRKRVRLSRAQHKHRILAAALVEALVKFGARGLEGASTTTIAQRAVLSQTGLHAHFKSKEDILLSLLTEILLPAHNAFETANALQPHA